MYFGSQKIVWRISHNSPQDAPCIVGLYLWLFGYRISFTPTDTKKTPLQFGYGA